MVVNHIDQYLWIVDLIPVQAFSSVLRHSSSGQTTESVRVDEIVFSDGAAEKVDCVWAITGIVPGFENRFSSVGLVQMEITIDELQ